MQKAQESLLRIVSDVLWKNTSEQVYTESDWEQILTLAEEQGVLFLVLQGCATIRQQISSTSWLKWRSKLVSTILNNESIMTIQREILSLMAEAGIPCAILKGASLAADYYNPAARAFGDIDLLIAKQFSAQAIDILLAQGFFAPNESFEHPYHIDFYRSGVVVELHFAISTFNDSEAGNVARQILESWKTEIRQKNIGETTFPCLSERHQALSLLIHMERHMTTGCIGLRQLCDWAVFVKSIPSEYFESAILPNLESCGLATFAEVLTKTTVDYLGLDVMHVKWCLSVNDSSVRAMVGEIFRTGSIHNKNNTDDTSSLFVEFSGMESASVVFIRKLSSLAKRKFPITQKIPVLLPVFWLYMPVRYWIRSLLGTRKKKSLVRTIAITKQRKCLYRELKFYKTDKYK